MCGATRISVSCLEFPLPGGAGVNLELPTVTLLLRVLKSNASLATFLQCCREGHSSLSIISFTLEVLMTNRAASSVLLMFCLVCGSHAVQAYSSMGWMKVLQAVTFNWVALILRLYHKKPCWPWSRWYVCADPSSDPAVW